MDVGIALAVNVPPMNVARISQAEMLPGDVPFGKAALHDSKGAPRLAALFIDEPLTPKTLPGLSDAGR